jgi:SAM-dependent methyltransferase
LFPRDCIYTCLDSDVLKLRRFSTRYPNDGALLADAAGMPLDSESIDVVLCKFVSHHIAAKGLPALMSEAARVLKPAGRFVFVDAVWSPERRLARLLWKYDRGSFPRTEEDIKASITSHFDILAWERLTVFHRYAICVAALKANGPPLDYAHVPTRAPAQIT